jgi:hypothetical protein
VSCCLVITLVRFKLDQVSMIPLDICNTCQLQSFSSNSTRIMLYLIHEMVIDYLVVDEMANMSNCLITPTCLE